MDAETPQPPTPLAAYLTAKMEEQGIKPVDLAGRARLSQSAISQMLSGAIRNPTGKAICGLRDAVGDTSYDPLMDAVCRTVRAA